MAVQQKLHPAALRTKIKVHHFAAWLEQPKRFLKNEPDIVDRQLVQQLRGGDQIEACVGVARPQCIALREARV